MAEESGQSRTEQRFGEWMLRRGANEEAFWACYNLVSAGDLLVLAYQDAFQEYGLSRDEWRILVMLDLVGQSEPRRLAESLWLGRSTVVNAVTRMEKQGLVSREPATNDRRLVVIKLTEAGRARMEDAAPAYIDTINGLDWSGFSKDEMEQLYRLSGRFWRNNAHLAKKSIEASPRVRDAEA